MNGPYETEAEALAHDAIEAALWQDLADALTRLEDYGLLPLPDLAEVDAGPVINGGVRDGGYLLRRSELTETPAFCWVVAPRGTETTDG